MFNARRTKRLLGNNTFCDNYCFKDVVNKYLSKIFLNMSPKNWVNDYYMDKKNYIFIRKAIDILCSMTRSNLMLNSLIISLKAIFLI